MQPLALISGTHVETAVALVLALASTTLISLAYLREHEAVGNLPALSLRHPLRSLRLLLALVQSVAAGGIGILAVAAARLGRRRLTRREGLGAGVSVAGLLFLSLSLLGGGDQGPPGSLHTIALWLGGTFTAAAVVPTVRGS